MQLRYKRKIYKKKFRLFAGDSQTLSNKRHFVISMIAINMFYCSIFTCIPFFFFINTCRSVAVVKLY